MVSLFSLTHLQYTCTVVVLNSSLTTKPLIPTFTDLNNGERLDLIKNYIFFVFGSSKDVPRLKDSPSPSDLLYFEFRLSSRFITYFFKFQILVSSSC